MAATYSSAVVIKKHTTPAYAPDRKWDVIPYLANVAVTADQQLGITDERLMETVYGKMIELARSQRIYDQVIVKEFTVICPS